MDTSVTETCLVEILQWQYVLEPHTQGHNTPPFDARTPKDVVADASADVSREAIVAAIQGAGYTQIMAADA